MSKQKGSSSDKEEEDKEEELEVAPELSLLPSNFPSSRQAYVAGKQRRKADGAASRLTTSTPKTIYEKRKILRANRKARKDRTGDELTTNPAAVRAAKKKSRNIYERSKLFRVARKAGEAQSPTNQTADADGATKSIPRTIHEMNQLIGAGEARSRHEAARVLDATREHDIEHGIENNVSRSAAFNLPTASEDVVSEGSSIDMPEQTPVLLEARIVEEPELIYAEQLSFTRYEVHRNNKKRTSRPPWQRGRWMCRASLLILVLMLGVLAGVVLTRPNKREDNGESDAPMNDHDTPPPTNTFSPAQSHPFFLEALSFLPNFTLEAIAKDSNSPQAEALSWVQEHSDFDNMAVWRKQQLMALCTLYYSTKGESLWNSTTRRWWLSFGIDECEWNGETVCTSDGKYQELWLPGCGLKGQLPPEISFLKHLATLHLDNNELNGPLPTEVGLLTVLTSLHMEKNALTGLLPSQLGQMTALAYLGCHNNALNGDIPLELAHMTRLTSLWLSSNALSGNIPSELGLMTDLTQLLLRHNKLDGPIPSSLPELTSLVDLHLQNNKLIGGIPSELGQVVALTGLTLRDNQFTGSIPSSLSQLTRLVALHLYNNGFSGRIPSEIGQLTALTMLGLNANQLTGTIPTSLAQLTRLVGLWLFYNSLSGPIPSELGQLTALTRLVWHDNALSGPIPEELQNLAALTMLSLNNNQLSGTIPYSLNQLTSSVTVLLHNNSLNGVIPTQLAQLTALNYLYLSDNQLTGAIPTGICALTELVDLWVDCDMVNCSCSQCTCH